MRQPQFHPRKNDFFFALLVAAGVAVTAVGAVTGYLDFARGRVAANVAKARAPAIALHDAGRQAPKVERAGVGK